MCGVKVIVSWEHLATKQHAHNYIRHNYISDNYIRLADKTTRTCEEACAVCGVDGGPSGRQRLTRLNACAHLSKRLCTHVHTLPEDPSGDQSIDRGEARVCFYVLRYGGVLIRKDIR